MVPPRAPDPGQRLGPRGASRRGGRWAPHGRPGVRRRARAGARGGALPPCLPAALPAAAPAARRGPDCQRRPRAGMRRRRRWRRAGGRGGGPGAGRGWGYLGGPSGPGHPPGAGRSGGRSGRPGPRDWASPGSSPDRRPGGRGARALSRHAWPRAASPARLEARRPSCLVPARALGTGGHSSPSPPLRALQGRPRRPALAPPTPPRRRLGARPRPDRSGPAGALLPFARTQLHALRPHTRKFGVAGPPPARPLLASRPARPLAQPLPGAHLPQPSGSWTGPPQLRAAWDSGPRLRESETGILASLRPGRALSSRVLSKSLTSPGLRFLIQEINIRPRGCESGRSLRKVFLNLLLLFLALIKSCLAFLLSGRLFYLPFPVQQSRPLAQRLAHSRWLQCLWNE